jgi:TrmH family RNA methyltransferase
MTEPITSPQNEKLKLLRRLADRRHREREGLFVTEGEDLLAAGLAAGRRPTELLVAAGSGVETAGQDATPVDPELIGAVSALGSGTRAIAIWPIPAPAGAGEPDSADCVFLDGVGDPGNVGTIVRAAVALWGARVVAGPGSADPYGPKAVRASMGALFAMPPRSGGLETTPEPRLGLVARGGGDLDEAIVAHRPRTLCLGAEREGLADATLAGCAGRASIPVREGAESLNVAASAAIALHRISSTAGAGGTV